MIEEEVTALACQSGEDWLHRNPNGPLGQGQLLPEQVRLMSVKGHENGEMEDSREKVRQMVTSWKVIGVVNFVPESSLLLMIFSCRDLE